MGMVTNKKDSQVSPA